MMILQSRTSSIAWRHTYLSTKASCVD